MLGLDIAIRVQNLITLASAIVLGAHQNLNVLRDMTTYSGIFVILGLGLATINLLTKFEVSITAHYEDMKRDSKCCWGS